MIKLKDLIVEKNYRLDQPPPNYKRAGKKVLSRINWYMKKFANSPKGYVQYFTFGRKTEALEHVRFLFDVNYQYVSDTLSNDEIEQFDYKKILALVKKLPDEFAHYPNMPAGKKDSHPRGDDWYKAKDDKGSFYYDDIQDYLPFVDKKGNDKAASIRKKIIQLFADGIKKAERVKK